MANYILGDEALYAYLIGAHPSASKLADQNFRTWAKRRSAQDFLFASRMSVAVLTASIERIPEILKRDATRAALNSKLISQFKDSLLEVDDGVLNHWSTLRAAADDTAGNSLSSEQMIEVATALDTGYIYVAPISGSLKLIQQTVKTLLIEDPWV